LARIDSQQVFQREIGVIIQRYVEADYWRSSGLPVLFAQVLVERVLQCIAPANFFCQRIPGRLAEMQKFSPFSSRADGIGVVLTAGSQLL
jgi:hypothetical protein